MPDTNRRHFDVIVVGAGPAGLAVASELSRSLRVLVLDKKKRLGYTAKSWFFPTFAIEPDKQDILPYCYPGVRRFLTDTFVPHQNQRMKRAWEGRLPDGYLYTKEEKLLEYWGGIVAANHETNGSEVMLDCTFHDHFVTEKEVAVQTSRGKFSAHLLIDASGADSPVREQLDMIHDGHWWSVYGGIAHHDELPGPDMKVGDYMLWSTFRSSNLDVHAALSEGRPVFEYEILDEHRTFVLILYLKRTRISLDHMRRDFEQIIREEPATAPFHDCRIDPIKWGWYPSGGLDQREARDRIAFIGDAGCWTTPCGWGMGFIVSNYKSYARRIVRAVKENRLDAATLKSFVSMAAHERRQVLLNEAIVRFLVNGDAEQLNAFVKLWDKTDFILCEKVFTLTIGFGELGRLAGILLHRFGRKGLNRLFPPGHRILTWADRGLVMQLGSDLVEDAALTLWRRVSGTQKNPPTSSGLENGFDFGDFSSEWD